MSSFDRTPRSMCGHVSNNEHATSHHLTRLNVESADLIATCNKVAKRTIFYNITVILQYCRDKTIARSGDMYKDDLGINFGH